MVYYAERAHLSDRFGNQENVMFIWDYPLNMTSEPRLQSYNFNVWCIIILVFFCFMLLCCLFVYILVYCTSLGQLHICYIFKKCPIWNFPGIGLRFSWLKASTYTTVTIRGGILEQGWCKSRALDKSHREKLVYVAMTLSFFSTPLPFVHIFPISTKRSVLIG